MAENESLFCNELWLTEHENHSTGAFSYSDAGDCEEAFRGFLQKEVEYAPEYGYAKRVSGNCWIEKARVTAILWFVKSHMRLSLSLETVFYAVNYFDRFCSLKKCQVWDDWMFELVSVACLSTASKFNETNAPTLHQIQMEGLQNSFESSSVQQMELNVLKSLEWRLRPTTSYSYVDLFEFNHAELLTDLLVNALLDSRFLEFRPSVIAICALQHVSEELNSGKDGYNWSSIDSFRDIISPCQQENLIKCYGEMKALDNNCNITNVSSPVTVLPGDYEFLLMMQNTDSFNGTRILKNKKLRSSLRGR